MPDLHAISRAACFGTALALVGLAGPAAQAAGADDPSAGQPPPATDVQRPGTLSDKLGESGGVIHPQENVDPAIHKPAPPTGTTPVIPPPGSPGSDSKVQPK